MTAGRQLPYQDTMRDQRTASLILTERAPGGILPQVHERNLFVGDAIEEGQPHSRLRWDR